jgi:hypothetical protein
MFSPTSERVIDTETTSAPTATKVAANHAGQTSHRRDAPPASRRRWSPSAPEATSGA